MRMVRRPLDFVNQHLVPASHDAHTRSMPQRGQGVCPVRLGVGESLDHCVATDNPAAETSLPKRMQKSQRRERETSPSSFFTGTFSTTTLSIPPRPLLQAQEQ